MYGNPNYNTCRVCGNVTTDHKTGPMYKYGTRHYAHATCGFKRWGLEWLDKQPDWVLAQFPFFLAKELGILDYLRAKAADTDLSWLPNGGKGVIERLERMKREGK